MNNDFNLDADTNPKICPLCHVSVETGLEKGDLKKLALL
jgi:hypothetical protein